MAVLAEIVKSVLVIVILASFLELLLPEGGVKPFVQFAIGLFVLIAVLNPVLSYMFDDRDFQVQLWDYTEELSETEEILEGGREVSNQIMNNHNDMVRDKLRGQISAVAMLVPGVEDVQAEVELSSEGSVNSLCLVVRPEKDTAEEDSNIDVFSGGEEAFDIQEQEQIKKKILQVMKNLYGINSIDIQIEFEGG